MTTNTTDEIIAYLNYAIADLKREPGNNDWAKGYDLGFSIAARQVIRMLTTTEED